MKKFLAIFAVLLLCGGGIGAYLFMGQDAVASISQEVAHDTTAPLVEQELHYVELSPLLLPIVDQRGVSQVVSLVVSLEIGDATMVDKVTRLSPRLTDAYIQDLYGVLNYKAALEGGVIQVGEVKRRLNVITHKLMGEGVINDVLLQVVSQRRV